MKAIRGVLLTLTFLFTLIVGTGSWAQENIDHVIGLYVHKNSLNWLEHNADVILDLNGYSATDYYHEKIEKRLEKTHFNKLVDNDSIQKVVRSLRYNFNRFLRGAPWRSYHEFEFNANGIEVTAEWDKFGFKVLPNPDELAGENSVLVVLEVKARHLRLFVDSFRVKDHQHSFLGDMGFNGIFLEIDRSKSQPLEISVPVVVKVLENGGIEIDIKEIATNISEVELKGGWRPPMLLPTVSVTIDGTRMTLKKWKVERMIKSKIPTALEGLTEMAQKFVSDEVAPMLEKLVNERSTGGFSAVNEMAPIGLPEGKYDESYIWSQMLKDISLDGENLHVQLDGWVLDPKLDTDLDIIDEHMAKGKPLTSTFSGENYDVALTLNQGLINRLLQYSNKRGYFKKMDASGQKLELTRQPYIKLKDRGERSGKKPALHIRTKYRVEGWKKIFVRNPIQIDMDLELDFSVNDGKLSMVISGIDLDSVKIENRYIKIFKKTVRKQAKKIVKKISKEIKGTVLADNLPIPHEVGGIPFKVKKTKIDPNGHLVVLMDVTI